jgi:serine/threonine-protein kinase
MTDAVRGKLSALAALQVIARQSSTEYKKSSKTLTEIGRELGVQYLLTATVRWQKRGAASRVQVSPELVQVSTGSTRWQQPFGASLTDVFQVQGQIAGQVAEALDVALGVKEKQTLADKPTQSLAAYDAYLKGEAAAPNLLFGDPQAISRATPHYGEAVALDSTFALGWAKLSLAHSSLYAARTPTPAQAKQALRAAERAHDLAPTRGEGHLALGFYHLAVVKDNVRAAEEFRKGQLASPSNVDLLVGRALAAQRVNLDTALTYLRQAQNLDPRSVSTAEQLAFTLLLLRRHQEARQAAEVTLALAPSYVVGLQYLAMIALAQGDLAGARAVLTAVPEEMDSGALLAHIAVYADLFWVLDETQQQQLLQLPLSAFGDDRVGWGLALAGTHMLRGNQVRARAYADSARIVAEEQLRVAPGDAQLHVLHGLSLAYTGRKSEAVRAGQRGVALMPIGKDAGIGPYLQHQLVRIYLLVGEPDKAMDQLEPLLKVPYYLTPSWLKIDPNFAPLRGNPRFRRLVKGP